MVIQLSATFAVVLVIQILFLIYASSHKAAKDVSFYQLHIASIALNLLLALNIIATTFDRILMAKIVVVMFYSFFIGMIGVLAKVKVNNFSNRTKYTSVVVFIIFLIVAVTVIIAFYDIINEEFFSFAKTDIGLSRLDSDKMLSMTVHVEENLWGIYLFFWMALFFIYAFLDITRIVMRSFVNSVHEIIIIIIFLLQLSLMMFLMRTPHLLVIELAIYGCLIPFLYYFLIHADKPLFVRRALRSRIFDYTGSMCLVFNADDKLSDFNETAQKFFGFTNKDIFRITLQDFITDYVPLGTVPSDKLSIDQIYVKSQNDERTICQLDYHRISYFKSVTICSFFVINDISSIVQRFAEIQQSTMTDSITGLLAQHVLNKKVREINIFRHFPYSAAACNFQFKAETDKNANFALIRVAECIKAKIRGSDFASYENGNIILLFPAELSIAQNVMERIIAAIEEDEYLKNDINFQYGLTARESPDEDIQQTINRAHSIMFKNKIEASIHSVAKNPDGSDYRLY